MDNETGKSRGTGFICFKELSSCEECLQDYVCAVDVARTLESKREKGNTSNSILFKEPSLTASKSKFILQGRFLNIAKHVSKTDALKLRGIKYLFF